MKKILILLMLSLCGTVNAAKVEGVIYDWKITRVVDGDTVEFEAKFLPQPLKPLLSIRVLGVDTPEKAPRAKCEKEAEAAKKASEFTKKLVSSATKTQIEIREWDKYGGRVLGDVLLDGKRLSEMLIENKHARPYFGEAKKSWCE
jgi:endonuclease YncB( thermonuclease family)